MRVAIVLNTSWNIYNFRQGLVNSFIKQGHQVIAIAPRDKYTIFLEEMGCDFYPVTMDNQGTNPLKDLNYAHQLYKAYKTLKPDFVLQFTIKPNIYGTFASYLLKIPTINNVCGLGTVFLNSGFSSFLAKKLYKFAFKLPNQVFFQNQDDLDLFLEKKLIKESITDLVPGSGVPLDKFKPKFAQNNDFFTFLVVSRVIYDKGIVEYAEAAKILKEKGIKAKFQLLGSQDDNDKRCISSETLKAWQEEGLIEYLGTSDDVASIMQKADCVVLPSYREGTPRSLLEAASLGKAIVTTDIAGCKQTVEDGKNGFLCEVQNAEDLATKMEKIYSLDDNTLQEMGKYSRKKMEDEFDEKIVIKQYWKAIKSITEEKKISVSNNEKIRFA